MSMTVSQPAFRAAASGFREYDARWRYPEEVSGDGFRRLGHAFGHWLHSANASTEVVIGHDWRSYSATLRDEFASGLISAGCRVRDLGLALSPIVYFAQWRLGGIAGAMITASHNPNGWTGAKVSAAPPLTFGPSEMAELRDLTLNGNLVERPGGRRSPVGDEIFDQYIGDLSGGNSSPRTLRVVCATGNGGAGAFAPRLLSEIGCDVVCRHVELDHSFPHYDPNPESGRMLADMGVAVREAGADFGLGFDGDGDRCGVVDETGSPILADRLGLLFARRLAAAHPGATFVTDVKSTGLVSSDPVLRQHDCRVIFARTGHSHIKRELRNRSALLGFERAGHFYFGPPIGRGYDDGLRAAVEVCRMVLEAGRPLSEIASELPETWTTPAFQPYCADSEKRAVESRIAAHFERLLSTGERFAGLRVEDVVTVSGARAQLANGAWGLIRASANSPNLVVIAESPNSPAEHRAIQAALDELLAEQPEVRVDDSGR